MNTHLLTLVAAAFLPVAAWATPTADPCPQDNTAVPVAGRTVTGQRPPVAKRLFTSKAVEEKIRRIKSQLTDRKLAEMFENCFPNTLDTTVHFRKLPDGTPDTFVYTGDIPAMWLRDSGAQVWPYVALANEDPELRELIAGVIGRQLRSIILDPYANAFNDGPTGGEWQSDFTDMRPEVHERKWEIDSLCYPVRLAYEYWKRTGDDSVFTTGDWQKAVALIVKTFREQQRKDDKKGPYRFLRRTDRALDTLNNGGWGAPVSGCGLIVSSFRPSDDTSRHIAPQGSRDIVGSQRRYSPRGRVYGARRRGGDRPQTVCHI